MFEKYHGFSHDFSVDSVSLGPLGPCPGLEAVDQGQLFGNILASMGDLQDPKMEVLYISIHLYHII